MSDFIQFTGTICPVEPDTYVQLKLSNGNEPIEEADTFYWGSRGRGDVYPIIEGYRVASEEEYKAYQERKNKFKAFIMKLGQS